MAGIFNFIRDLLGDTRPSCDSESSPPASKEFDQPWRTMPWGQQDELKQKLRNLRINHPNVQFVRILLVGDVGAGKSSFINSVNNAFQNRITSQALTDGVSGTSFTRNYTTFYIEGNDGSTLPFVFNDVMGFEEGEAGAYSKDIIKALSGFLQEGYNFEHASAMNNPGYRSNPSLQDQTSCLVNVMGASTVSLMSQDIINKMRKIREAATKLNIPQVIIMTKPDAACSLVNRDLKKKDGRV
ncbi:hypothetical protein HF521_013128 [Silurus meridionalis]|uniref:Interferon-induced protein 44-like n=2 Tax=Silurus meridionalis TaxID=175797 RepID=A0A8T0AED2_SILME|nr:hypothetical protein HF521_013128 [Silurus meridionalis]